MNLKKILTFLTPVLGAGAISVCPLCWIGSASLLTYLGLGVLIPWWRVVAFGFIILGGIGFILDYRAHKNPKPLALLILGAILLYVGRYVFLSTWGAWWIWGPGALMIIVAVSYNKSFFRKRRLTKTLRPQYSDQDNKNLYRCPECGFHYESREWSEKCDVWCREHKSCNIEITAHAMENHRNTLTN